jgi:hypothetical protein
MTPHFVRASRSQPSLAIGESERPPGKGHGMSRNRQPKRNERLPHDGERGDKQPYAHEVEDYAGERGKPPIPQTAPKDRRRQ